MADGETVGPDVAIVGEPVDTCDVLEVLVFGRLQIVHNDSGGNLAELHFIDAEALQADGVELAHEFFLGVVGGEDPLVAKREIEAVAKDVEELFFTAFIDNNLLGPCKGLLGTGVLVCFFPIFYSNPIPLAS